MKASQAQFELALDRGIDEWYVSRQQGAGSPTGTGEATPQLVLDVDLSGLGALDEASRLELDGLVGMLDLVAELAVAAPAHETMSGGVTSGATPDAASTAAALGTVDSPPAVATGAAPDYMLPVGELRHGSHRSGARLLLTSVAAVALLIAGIGIGVAVSGRGSPGSVVTHQPAAGGPRLPSELLSEVQTEADLAADPYPAQPVTWVKTTMGRVRALAPRNFAYAPATKKVEAAAPVWIAFLRGNFYGSPSQKSDVYHLNWYLYTSGQGSFGISGSSSGWLTDLSPLGTVQYLYLRPPPPQGILPARIDNYLEHWVQINGNVFPSQPALWAQTTVGRIRSLTGSAEVTPGLVVRIPTSISSGTTAWVVDIQRPVVLGHVTANQWYFTTSRSDESWFVQPLSDIQRYGQVHELWLTAGAPTSLSPLVHTQVMQAYDNRYSGVPGGGPTTVTAEWVGTTVAALEQLTKPQVDSDLSGIPGPTAVWVVELNVTPTPGHAGRSDWLTVTTQDPASSQVVGDYSEGASPFFGITELSQLGTVHPVTFHVTRGGTVTFSS